MSQIVRQNTRQFRKAGIYVSPAAQVVRSEIAGVTVFFTVKNPRDEIQKHHFAGEFYEREELDIIRRHFPIGGTFCDMGANVGNHSIFVAKLLHARRIVLIEPNPPAIEILESNIYLNGMEGVCDRRHLGVGVTDRDNVSGEIATPSANLGASVIRETESGGSIPLFSGDHILSGEDFDMIKIDVEGTEVKALAGLRETIARSRPLIFIEVIEKNEPEFHDWRNACDYKVLETFQRYPRNTNFMIGPV